MCATNIIKQMVQHREDKRTEQHREQKRRARAPALSQGQPGPLPNVIMVGDLNVTRDVLERDMKEMDHGYTEEDSYIMAQNVCHHGLCR